MHCNEISALDFVDHGLLPLFNRLFDFDFLDFDHLSNNIILKLRDFFVVSTERRNEINNPFILLQLLSIFSFARVVRLPFPFSRVFSVFSFRLWRLEIASCVATTTDFTCSNCSFNSFTSCCSRSWWLFCCAAHGANVVESLGMNKSAFI